MLLRIPQRREHCREFHGLVHVAGGKQKRADLYFVLVDHSFEEAVQGQNADHMVYTVLVDRDPGIRGGVDRPKDLLPGVIDVYGDDIHSGRHDL